MDNHVSIANVKDQLAALLRRAETGKVVHITRRGKPVAVILSEVEYHRLVNAAEGKQGFWQAVRRWRDEAAPAEDLSDDEIDSWRDRDTGRDVQ